MYNFNYNITYVNVPEKKQNEAYQKDILECFNLKTYNFKQIEKIQNQLFDLNKENKTFMNLLNYFKKNQTFIPCEIPIKTCLTLLFQFDYFYIFHNCLKDLHETNNISSINFENMTYLIKKNN